MESYTDMAGENLPAGQVCYRKSDGKLWKAKADASSKYVRKIYFCNSQIQEL